MKDLTEGKSAARVQCGIPGEKVAICGSCATDTSEEMMTELRPAMAAEGHLQWHAGWHALRLPKTVFTEDIFSKGQQLGRISKTTSYEDFKNEHVLGGTKIGEDFLYMHRVMVKMAQAHLAEKNLPCIAAWKELPAKAKDPQNQIEQYRAQLEKLRDPEFLRSVSLNRLGQIIEPGLHQNLHNYYRGNPICSREARAQGYCDDLIPVETSPLNKHFWKIHGLVDDLIGDWLKAHGKTEIAVDCQGRASCYQWQGTWTGYTRPN